MTPTDKWYEGDAAEQQREADVAATEAARTATDEINGAPFYDAGNSGAAISLDLRNGLDQRVVLSASAPTITIAHWPAGTRAVKLRLRLKQDATGSRLLPTFSPAANYGTPGAPTLTTTAAKTDILEIESIDNGTSINVVTVAKGF